MKSKSWVKFLLFLWFVAFLILMLAMTVHAQEEKTVIEEVIEHKGYYAIGAGIAIGLAGLGAGLGMGNASSAAIGAITERPEVFGKSMIFIVMLEAIAIYGLVIAILLFGLIG